MDQCPEGDFADHPGMGEDLSIFEQTDELGVPMPKMIESCHLLLTDAFEVSVGTRKTVAWAVLSPKSQKEDATVDMKLEVVPIPVSDVDAAKAFYTEKVGFNLDHDVQPNEKMRVVQMTPPGSACSVVIGVGLPLGEPGSVKGVQLVVEDIDLVREVLVGRGVGVSDVQQLGPEGSPGSRFVFFDDPDGNAWAIQER